MSRLDRAAGTIPAAAPVAAPRVTPLTNASTMTGFIRMIAETPEAGSYISKTLDPAFGVLLTCTELADAARVRLIPLMSNYGIRLVVSISTQSSVHPAKRLLKDFPEPYCWLGMVLIDSDPSAKKGHVGLERCVISISEIWKRIVDLAPSFGNLCPTSAPDSHVMGTSATDITGSARSNIWLFQSLDSCIVNTWSDPNCAFVYAIPMLCLL